MGMFVTWGIPLTVLASGAAVLLGCQQRPQHLLPAAAEVFCYQGVRTEAAVPSSPNACFTVAHGKFASMAPAEPGAHIRRGWALPGLWDGHGHLLQLGEFLHSVDLFGSHSPDEIRRRLHAYLDAHPDRGGSDKWIRGVGWDQMALGGMPTADMLETDRRLAGLYVMLDRVDLHCTWVSRAVLDLLGDDLPEAVPGRGVFCDKAMDLVLPLWPRPGAEEKKAYLRSAMRDLHAVGLVGVHDAGVFPRDMALLEDMSRTDDWRLRVYAMVECAERNGFCPESARRIYVEGKTGMLSVRSVKLFSDGALGSWGSAMLEPYSDRPGTSGSLLVNASTLTAVAQAWSATGFQVNIHAIGDLATRLSIDAMEAALRQSCSATNSSLADCQAQRRFRIEHSQIVHPVDQQRMHDVGIIPSIQPTHATSDMKYAEARLGKDRTGSEAYRMKSFLDLGPVLGSDFPVEPPNPFEGIYAAVTRKSPRTGQGPPGAEDGWYPAEALGVTEALEGFTQGPAWGAFLEGKAGIIGEGAFADWIVLDEALEAVSTEDIRHIRVRETWIAGNLVYSRDHQAEPPAEL